MHRVRLEIDEITIFRPKKRWNLYFLVVADHPTQHDKKIISCLPNEYPIRLHQRHNNYFQFDTDQMGAEGLYVLSQNLPPDRELNVHLHLLHTRSPLRQLGETLQKIKLDLGDNAFEIVENLLGNNTPWLIFAKKALPLLGKIITHIPDRKMGFVSCFERFGAEFEQQTEIDREKQFSGPASIVYSWSLEE